MPRACDHKPRPCPSLLAESFARPAPRRQVWSTRQTIPTGLLAQRVFGLGPRSESVVRAHVAKIFKHGVRQSPKTPPAQCSSSFLEAQTPQHAPQRLPKWFPKASQIDEKLIPKSITNFLSFFIVFYRFFDDFSFQV